MSFIYCEVRKRLLPTTNRSAVPFVPFPLCCFQFYRCRRCSRFQSQKKTPERLPVKHVRARSITLSVSFSLCVFALRLLQLRKPVVILRSNSSGCLCKFYHLFVRNKIKPFQSCRWTASKDSSNERNIQYFEKGKNQPSTPYKTMGTRVCVCVFLGGICSN